MQRNEKVKVINHFQLKDVERVSNFMTIKKWLQTSRPHYANVHEKLFKNKILTTKNVMTHQDERSYNKRGNF